MTYKTRGILFFIIGFVLIIITPYIMYPDTDETTKYIAKTVYNIFKNFSISWFFILLGFHFYFHDRKTSN